MVIFGAVDFTAALVKVAKVLGYRVTVCDARPVFATASRFRDHDQQAAGMMAYLERHLPEGTVLQLGGDETTGKGLCVVRLSAGKGVGHGRDLPRG